MWNPNLDECKDDILFHLALSKKNNDLSKFADIKFVCLGGSHRRMWRFAQMLTQTLEVEASPGQPLINLARGSDRYVLYKVGPVLIANHGIGQPSLSILLNEIFKLLYHAKATNVTFYRLGTSGGIGLKPGTVVVTTTAVDALCRQYHEMVILGKVVKRPAVMDEGVANDILNLSSESDGYDIVPGTTMSTSDFYEGQARTDGAFCNYSAADKTTFLKNLKRRGVTNFEMECACFSALCHHAGFKCGIVCVCLVDRLEEDQLTTPEEMREQWENRPGMIISRIIKKKLAFLQ